MTEHPPLLRPADLERRIGSGKLAEMFELLKLKYREDPDPAARATADVTSRLTAILERLAAHYETSKQFALKALLRLQKETFTFYQHVLTASDKPDVGKLQRLLEQMEAEFRTLKKGAAEVAAEMPHAAEPPAVTTPGTKVQRPIPPGGTPIDAPGRQPPKEMLANPELYYFEQGKFKRRPEPPPPFRAEAAAPTGVKVVRPVPEGGLPIDAPGLNPPKKFLENKELYYYQDGKFLRRPEPAPPFRVAGGRDPRAIPCFPAGTPVATPRGATPIEAIAVGGQVLSFDESTGTTVLRRVTAVLRNRTVTLVDITVGAAPDGQVITTTTRHRFWVENRGAFIAADRLEPGYLLRTDSGRLLPIGGVAQRRTPEMATWNLTVDDCHTYFAGACRVLVHNEGESGGKVYIGRNPEGQIVYVGLTKDDLLDRQAAHRQDAVNDPAKYGFKKDITLEVVEGMTGLTDDEMRWHERRVYDLLKARGEPLQNPLEETTTYEKLNALYERYC